MDIVVLFLWICPEESARLLFNQKQQILTVLLQQLKKVQETKSLLIPLL